jgi:4-amino-4-deoxy-L-arabinose transferase-like glycosyltransferase
MSQGLTLISSPWHSDSGLRFWAGASSYALLLLFPLLLALGSAPLFDVDEGAFSQATRELLASGDWWHTTLNGEARFDKPIGVYWLQAMSVWALGLNEFALRLPSALSGWLLALVCAQFTAHRLGLLAGAATGVVIVTSAGLGLIFRAATADALLNLLIVLAVLDAWRFVEAGSHTPLRRAYLWVGLGLLVKGPVAVVVPAATFVLWAVSCQRWGSLRSAVFDGPGWALLLAVAVPWYAYALNRHGMAFVDGFFLRHNLQRFSGILEGHGGGFFYYLLVLPVLCMPWTPLVVAGLARLPHWWRDGLGRYLLIWAAFVFVFFSLSGTKLPHYVLYGFAPLAIFAGCSLATASHALRRWTWAGLFVWLAALASVPQWVVQHAEQIKDPLYSALLRGSSGAPWELAAGLILLLLAAASVPLKPSFTLWRLFLAGVLISAFTAFRVIPWWAETLQGPVRQAALALRAQHPGAKVVQWQLNLPSMGVYLQSTVARRLPQSGEWTLTRRDRMTEADAALMGPVFFEERGVVLLGPAP